MSDKDLDLAKKILQQDINACVHLFEKNDFMYMNIVANRYLENCLIFDDYRLCLPGIFIKDMVNDFNSIINHPDKSKKINSAKAIGERFILMIREYFKDLNEKNLWKEFYIYNLNINDFLRDIIDAHYLKNLPFSSQAFKFLLNYLENNINYLYVINNRFLEGIISIIIRIIRNHSFSINEIMIYIYIKYLDFLYQYLYYENFKNDHLDTESLKKELLNYLEFIQSLKEKKEFDFINFDKSLWKIVKKWREMYIFYKNFPIQSKVLKEEVVIPLKVKQEKRNEQK